MFWFLIYIQILNKIYSLESSIGWAFIGRSSCGLSGFSRRSCRYSLGGTVAPQVPQGGVAGIHWAEQWRSQRLLKAELQVLIGRSSCRLLNGFSRRSGRYSLGGAVAVSVAPQGGVAGIHWTEQWRYQLFLTAEWQVFIGWNSGSPSPPRRSRWYSLGRSVAVSTASH